jgi:hypothetical protein
MRYLFILNGPAYGMRNGSPITEEELLRWQAAFPQK